MGITRRDFLVRSTAAATASALGWRTSRPLRAQAAPFRISLAQWSLHRELKAKALDHLDFASVAKKDFGIEAVEYVNTFFKDKAKDAPYLAEMNARAKDLGVYQHLIMCDGEGQIGDPDAAKRTQAVENHYKWVDAARTLDVIERAFTAHAGHQR